MTEFMPTDLENRLDVLTQKLMPADGPADTVEGEMLRAINRILYRYYNDGDKWFTGYGCETAGPAAAFLMEAELPVDVKKELDQSDGCSSPAYEKLLFKAAEKIINYVESRSEYQENTFDMFDYDSQYEWEEEEEWDDDDYDDEYEDEEEWDDDDDDDF